MANIHTPIPALKLNDGNAIPMVGLHLSITSETPKLYTLCLLSISCLL